MLEFGLVLVPMLALLFVTIDIAWAIFARSTLQFAVREGVRYAVTGQTLTGMGQVSSIKTVVQSNAIGLLNGTDGLSKIQVNFYTADTLQDVSTVPGGNVGGNLVQVSVQGFPWFPLFPLLRSATPLTFSALSADRMEATPPGGPPAM